MGRAVGIDVGTSSCVIAAVENDQACSLGTVRTAVAIDDKENWLVGDKAFNQGSLNPEQLLSSITRFVGREKSQVVNRSWAYSDRCAEDHTGRLTLSIGSKPYAPELLLSKVLRELMNIAEARLATTNIQAVVAVPAPFDFTQRDAVRIAARIAGIEVIRIVASCNAAAIEYARRHTPNAVVAVIDFGGGTLTTSVLDIGGLDAFQDFNIAEVLVADGDGYLGGDDWDMCLADYLLEHCAAEFGTNVTENAVAVQQLRVAAEQTKRALSDSEKTDVRVPILMSSETDSVDFNMELSRACFEDLTHSLFSQLETPVSRVFKEMKLRSGLKGLGHLHCILILGGSAHIPKAREIFARIVSDEQPKSSRPEHAVAHGAAIQAAFLTGELPWRS